jgi:hypothetical protein
MLMPNNLDNTILFKDMILENIDDIKTYMKWENYTLNNVVIPVTEMVKDHALIVLMNSYGLFHVEQDIFDSFCADVFIYFPILLQQLAITRLIDAYGVVTDDTDIVTTVRTETLDSNTEQTSELTQGTTQTDANVLATQHKTTGTIKDVGTASNTQTTLSDITNTSGVESSGSRNVNLSHNMPEQSINGITGLFPADSQGTPKLTTSYVQTATEAFNTSNPINTSESSHQTGTNGNTGNNSNTTTNDITVADTGTTTRTSTNSGSDSTEAKTATKGNNTISETVTSQLTNKQYAYEIKAFLETADGLIAFSRWEDRFTWVIGII